MARNLISSLNDGAVTLNSWPCFKLKYENRTGFLNAKFTDLVFWLPIFITIIMKNFQVIATFYWTKILMLFNFFLITLITLVIPAPLLPTKQNTEYHEPTVIMIVWFLFSSVCVCVYVCVCVCVCEFVIASNWGCKCDTLHSDRGRFENGDGPHPESES